MWKRKLKLCGKTTNAQKPFQEITNFVVNSRLRFARIFMLVKSTIIRSSQLYEAETHCL